MLNDQAERESRSDTNKRTKQKKTKKQIASPSEWHAQVMVGANKKSSTASEILVINESGYQTLFIKGEKGASVMIRMSKAQAVVMAGELLKHVHIDEAAENQTILELAGAICCDNQDN